MQKGDSVGEIGVNMPSCYIGASDLVPGFLPPLQDSRSFGNCTLSIGDTKLKWTAPALEIALCQSGRPGRDGRGPKPGIRAGQPLSPRPRPLLSAWAQSRTGTPDAEDGRGQSSGPGCEDRASSSLAARQSAPSSGNWSMVSAPTHSPLCGLPRLIGPPLSQQSVHNRNAE